VLTQCPECQTVFRVTSTILRAAHGQVRCGKCNTQFDAIENLIEGEEDVAVSDGTENAITETPPASYEPAAISHEDIVLEGNRIEISGVYRKPAVHLDDEQSDDEAHTHTIIEEFNTDAEEWGEPEEWDEAEAGDDDGDADVALETELEDIEQELSAAEIANAMASLEPEHTSTDEDDDDDVDATAAAAASTSRSTRVDLLEASLPATRVINESTSVPAAFDDELFGRKPELNRWPWLLASISLLLLLAVQSIHHARAALARHPSIGPQITRLYAAVGQPLEPQWQLQAYSIKQWGIVSDPQAPGTLRVRASVTNGANIAQPYPLLQLALEDRFGGSVGKRTFKPEEYLGQSLATRMLGAGEAANIDLAIVDPGQEAVGFQFDTCLQTAHELQCTHDMSTVRP
jgi:predicted Zn finger-like uncharacterized protein